MDIAIAVLATSSVALAFKLRSSQAGIGLALVNLIGFSSQTTFHLNCWVNLETSLGVISRLRTFEEETPVEATDDALDPNDASLTNWPATGNIEFQSVCAKYNDDDLSAPRVLDNITFAAKPGQKIGICGRTGR